MGAGWEVVVPVGREGDAPVRSGLGGAWPDVCPLPEVGVLRGLNDLSVYTNFYFSFGLAFPDK